MVVDDNQDILFNIKILLEAKGYKVKTATSGEMALSMLSSGENPPEVIADGSGLKINVETAKMGAVSISSDLLVLSAGIYSIREENEDLRGGSRCVGQRG